MSGSKALLVDSETGDNGKGPDARLKGDADNQLYWLSGLFAPDGVVILSGCRVAANAKWRDGTGPVDGKELLKAVSHSLGGVWVEASEFKQNMTPGMEGNCIRCNNGTCGVVTDGAKYFWGPIGGKFRPQ